jgi:prepilin-type N-terminal cleavage/methylation domain-containing protein
MHAQRTSTTSGAPIRALRAFTIVELLVVIGVIGILSLLTTLGARRLTAGSRLASATNAVTSALGNARAAAIKDSAVTGIVFRATYDPAKPQLPQHVELITIRSTGERSIFGTTSIGARMVERYRPVLGIPSTVLPEGIKVGGPMYDPPGSFGSISSELVLATQVEIKSLVNCTESIEFNRYGEVRKAPRLVEHLLTKVAPKFADRAGGYTRIVKLDKRRVGDGTDLVLLQLVGSESGSQISGRAGHRRKRADKRAAFAKKVKEAAAAKKVAA